MINTARLSLLFALTVMLATTGCMQKIISPRELANEKPQFTAQEKFGDLTIKAKALTDDEFFRIFENNGRGFIPFDLSPKLIYKKHRVILLSLNNKGARTYTAESVGGTIAAKSEIMPQFSHHEETTVEKEKAPEYQEYYPNKDLPGEEKPTKKRYTSKIKTISYLRSDNGLNKRDVETLKTFGLFSDKGENAVTVGPYDKQVKIVFVTKKEEGARYKVRFLVKHDASWGPEQVVLRV